MFDAVGCITFSGGEGFEAVERGDGVVGRVTAFNNPFHESQNKTSKNTTICPVFNQQQNIDHETQPHAKSPNSNSIYLATRDA